MRLATSVAFTALFLLHTVIVQAQVVDIVQTAINAGNFQTLVTALTAADLVTTLQGPGPFTVFAPTDAAFNKLPPGTVEDLLKPENKEKLSNILKYHVIGGRVTSADINMMTLPAQVDTLLGLRSIVDKNGNAVKVNGATVTTADVACTNGIIHIIDTVLSPPTDIVDTAVSENFTTLVTAVRAADLVTTLKGAGPFTVFAPTDAAFAKLPGGVVGDLVKPENKPTLTRILQYHVVGSLVTTGSINRMTLPANVTTSQNESVTVSKNGNNVMINNAAVVAADVFNSNGMIHAIDSVLLPSLDIVETAIVNGNFKTLVTALRAADLVGALSGPGPLTVFAPTDEAFQKLPAGTVEDLLKPENKEKLSNILKYHVIGKSVTSGDINMMTLPAQVETLAGNRLQVIVDKNENAVKVNGATVTLADVSSTNGIIHVIDTVLLPPTDIVDTAVSENFTTLVAAVRAADLATTLKGPGPFTVFAPTDEAFAKLPGGVVGDLVKPENKPTLTRILQYHVVGSLVTTGSINRMTLPANVTTVGGGSVTVSKNGNNVLINNAAVVTADVFNSNGMIHAIDSVLLPPLDIVETAIVNGVFKTLVTALGAADLVAALKGTGPFTVFAPNDAAFNKLPAGVVTDLVKSENKPTLSRILQYHVTNGNLTAAVIEALTLPANVTMLAGGYVTVSRNGASLKVNDAVVISANVFGTNGIIHVLDSVLLPPLDIVETAIVSGTFKTLVTALGAAGLVETLKGTGPFTVFAPTDEAFSKLANGTVEDLLKPENKEKLSNILKYHVIGKRVTLADINNMTLPAKEEMLAGGTVTITKDGNNIKINDATVTKADVSSINGIIHIIDTVLLPSAPSSTTSFYVNRGFFTVFVLGILFSYRFSV